MGEDALGRVLRLVAERRLSPEEAAPILEALAADRGAGPVRTPAANDPEGSALHRRAAPRFARIEIVEGGRRAVDLRIPLALGRRALGAIPGLSAAQVAELDEAVSRGLTGPLVDVSDEAGDGVRIVLE